MALADVLLSLQDTTKHSQVGVADDNMLTTITSPNDVPSSSQMTSPIYLVTVILFTVNDWLPRTVRLSLQDFVMNITTDNAAVSEIFFNETPRLCLRKNTLVVYFVKLFSNSWLFELFIVLSSTQHCGS